MKTPVPVPFPTPAAAPAIAEADALQSFATSSGLLARFARWLRSFQIGRPAERRLKVADTVSLGEKRFVAVVQVDGRHFLLAGGPANIALLAQLNEKDDFEDVLKKTMTAPAITAAEEPVKPERKRAAPRKKVTAAVAAPAPAPTRAKAVAQGKKASSAAVKKQPAVAAKRTSKPAAPRGRFGDIPATRGGARAFEQWLGRAVPVATTRGVTANTDSPAPAQNVSETVTPPGPSPLPPKQTLNEWLQETRTLPEKPAVQSIAEPAAPAHVEEYA
jgi:flagellar biogenesis protein FliO